MASSAVPGQEHPEQEGRPVLLVLAAVALNLFALFKGLDERTEQAPFFRMPISRMPNVEEARG
ncbi:hypothetical protein [Streptacidiphilus sp. MAP5-3]|uniref:hypothetical protein n=1 Tax=unclassified Streptacidiphilus TaxID=2643834 RepID=UPI0035177B07